MKLLIQIPCYNEEKTLPVTVADLPRSVKGIDEIEYLIIDDGSTDNTALIARECGVHHIVKLKMNSGLARAFITGVDACLKLGADIIVNTDADNQYNAADIEKLIEPILKEQADIVIGERPIDKTKHFSFVKKRLQRLGSLVVRIASGTKIPDAPSGFRAYSREAALRINVHNMYTYTLETIIQAGNNRISITSVPVRTNPELRKSRLFKSMWGYIQRSATVIVRSVMMYRPLKFFMYLGTAVSLVGVGFIVRWFILSHLGGGGGNIPSLVLAAMLIMVGVQLIIAGLQADVAAANRKMIEDVQYRVRKMECECVDKNTDTNKKR
ncbi:MAG: glycosyltransferase family 2 protein [Oscillospiraceae bacterium]|nr:glycosyltransferase family 2 protein [Oscillospiraceae bacterium]